MKTKPKTYAQQRMERTLTSLVRENIRLRAALFELSEAVSDLNPLYDDDSRAETYAVELKNLSAAQDAAREVLANKQP